MKISLFSTADSPMIGLFAKEIGKDYKIDSIILDKKRISEKDSEIWIKRTNNRIEYYDINDLKDIKIISVDNHNDEYCNSLINEKKIDLIINCGTPRILSNEIINSPSIGILNCHPGLLPKYRGCTCVEWALYNNENIGNTCHLMSKKIDSGPIVLKEKISIDRYKSYQEIRVAVYLNSISVIKKSIKILMSGKNLINNLEEGTYYKPIDEGKMNIILKRYGNEIKEI